MARTHMGMTMFVKLEFDHNISRLTRRKTVLKKKAVGAPKKNIGVSSKLNRSRTVQLIASLLVCMLSHLTVSCFVHGSRQTKQPEDDMCECLCPKPSHTTVPVSLVVA